MVGFGVPVAEKLLGLLLGGGLALLQHGCPLEVGDGRLLRLVGRGFALRKIDTGHGRLEDRIAHQFWGEEVELGLQSVVVGLAAQTELPLAWQCLFSSLCQVLVLRTRWRWPLADLLLSEEDLVR